MTKQAKSAITTHILDLDSGKPAAGIEVTLLNPQGESLGKAHSNADGRVERWAVDFSLVPGCWQLVFCVAPWFQAKNKSAFYSDITIAFNVAGEQAHYHVPLLLNAFGYSTYRGS